MSDLCRFSAVYVETKDGLCQFPSALDRCGNPTNGGAVIAAG